MKLTLIAFVGNKQSTDLKTHGSTIKIKKNKDTLEGHGFKIQLGPIPIWVYETEKCIKTK
jgi:hypothetical protein